MIQILIGASEAPPRGPHLPQRLGCKTLQKPFSLDGFRSPAFCFFASCFVLQYTRSIMKSTVAALCLLFAVIAPSLVTAGKPLAAFASSLC